MVNAPRQKSRKIGCIEIPLWGHVLERSTLISELSEDRKTKVRAIVGTVCVTKRSADSMKRRFVTDRALNSLVRLNPHWFKLYNKSATNSQQLYTNLQVVQQLEMPTTSGHVKVLLTWCKRQHNKHKPQPIRRIRISDFGLPDPKRDPDRHQNCITWSLSHALPVQKNFVKIRSQVCE